MFVRALAVRHGGARPVAKPNGLDALASTLRARVAERRCRLRGNLATAGRAATSPFGGSLSQARPGRSVDDARCRGRQESSGGRLPAAYGKQATCVGSQGGSGAVFRPKVLSA